MYSKSAINIRGFQAFPVVRSKKSGGGLYIGVKHGLCESIMIDDSENADLVTIRLSRKEHGIRIILIYGPQENDLEETVLFTMMYQCKWKQHSLMVILSFYWVTLMQN